MKRYQPSTCLARAPFFYSELTFFVSEIMTISVVDMLANE